MGVASGCGEQEVGVASGSGWNIWVWLLGVVVRRYIVSSYYLFLLLLYLFFFTAASLLFVHFLMFFVLFHPYEGCTYCFIHEQAHTNVRFLSCDGHQLYERGVDLEVEGVRYIEMHRGTGQIFLGAYFRLRIFQAPLLHMRSTCALRRSRPVLVYRARREII